MQLIFKDGELKQQSKLDKLFLLRKHYYTELERTINLLRIQKIQALQSFKNVCIDIDKEIAIEKRKQEQPKG